MMSLKRRFAVLGDAGKLMLGTCMMLRATYGGAMAALGGGEVAGDGGGPRIPALSGG